MYSIKKLEWSENFKPTYQIKQNHCIAKTPLGNIIIKWERKSKYSWIEIHTPWNAWGYGGTLDEAKMDAERDYVLRIKQCLEDSE